MMQAHGLPMPGPGNVLQYRTFYSTHSLNRCMAAHLNKRRQQEQDKSPCCSLYRFVWYLPAHVDSTDRVKATSKGI